MSLAINMSACCSPRGSTRTYEDERAAMLVRSANLSHLSWVIECRRIGGRRRPMTEERCCRRPCVGPGAL